MALDVLTRAHLVVVDVLVAPVDVKIHAIHQWVQHVPRAIPHVKQRAPVKHLGKYRGAAHVMEIVSVDVPARVRPNVRHVQDALDHVWAHV